MLLLQGLSDPVVPPAQSQAFADALAERGVPCTYLTFEGEAHGSRRAETRSAPWPPSSPSTSRSSIPELAAPLS
ncbi:hypothetical protein GCM10018952_71480 [Streptosporangium vulgare]